MSSIKLNGTELQEYDLNFLLNTYDSVYPDGTSGPETTRRIPSEGSNMEGTTSNITLVSTMMNLGSSEETYAPTYSQIHSEYDEYNDNDERMYPAQNTGKELKASDGLSFDESSKDSEDVIKALLNSLGDTPKDIPRNYMETEISQQLVPASLITNQEPTAIATFQVETGGTSAPTLKHQGRRKTKQTPRTLPEELNSFRGNDNEPKVGTTPRTKGRRVISSPVSPSICKGKKASTQKMWLSNDPSAKNARNSRKTREKNKMEKKILEEKYSKKVEECRKLTQEVTILREEKEKQRQQDAFRQNFKPAFALVRAAVWGIEKQIGSVEELELHPSIRDTPIDAERMEAVSTANEGRGSLVLTINLSSRGIAVNYVPEFAGDGSPE